MIGQQAASGETDPHLLVDLLSVLPGLDASTLRAQVERLVDGAPMLEELWVFVPGYAHHHQLFRRTTPRSMKSA